MLLSIYKSFISVGYLVRNEFLELLWDGCHTFNPCAVVDGTVLPCSRAHCALWTKQFHESTVFFNINLFQF